MILNKIILAKQNKQAAFSTKTNVIMFEFLNYFAQILNLYVSMVKINVVKNNITLRARNFNDVNKILFILLKHSKFQFIVLSDMFGIDQMQPNGRFKVVYTLLSIRFNVRLRLNVIVNEFDQVPSCTEIFKCAGWLEREIWDMFGIFFINHSDLRRILTDYGFNGFPLRKDFPLSGFIELRYDDSLKRVVYEPIETSQEFRFFDFRSPWEQIENLY